VSSELPPGGAQVAPGSSVTLILASVPPPPPSPPPQPVLFTETFTRAVRKGGTFRGVCPVAVPKGAVLKVFAPPAPAEADEVELSSVQGDIPPPPPDRTSDYPGI
jgi:hypothetical protein